MANTVFEIQGPDGTTYEVEAPSQAAALEGFRRHSSQGAQGGRPGAGSGGAMLSGPGGQPPAGAVDGPRNASGQAVTRGGGSPAPLVPHNRSHRLPPDMQAENNAFLQNMRDNGTSGGGFTDALATGLGGNYFNAAMNSVFPFGPARFGQFRNNLELERQRDDVNDADGGLRRKAGKFAGMGMGLGKVGAAGGTFMRFVPQGLDKGKKLLATTAALAGDGAAIAGFDAFTKGQDVTDAMGRGSLMGGGANLALRGAARGAQAFRDSKVANALSDALPSVDELKTAASGLYSRVGQSGTEFADDAVNALRRGVADDMGGPGVGGLDPVLHRGTSRLVDDLNADGPMTAGRLHQLAKRAKRVSGPHGEDADAARVVGGNIRDFLRSSPATRAGDMGGAEVADTLARADRGHRLARSAEELEAALAKGTRMASKSGTGGNLDNSLRSALERVRSGKASKFLDDATVAKLDAAIAGTRGRNLARSFGRTFAPSTGTISALANGGMGVATGGATIPLSIAGELAKAGATRSTEKAARQIVNTLKRDAALTLKVGDVEKALASADAESALAGLLAKVAPAASRIGGGVTGSAPVASPAFADTGGQPLPAYAAAPYPAPRRQRRGLFGAR